MGAAGKLICKHCRKRKSSVEPSLTILISCVQCQSKSVNDPCNFCIERGLQCEKVWGDKKARRMQGIGVTSASTGQQDQDIGLIFEARPDDVGSLVHRSVPQTHMSNLANEILVPIPPDPTPFYPNFPVLNFPNSGFPNAFFSNSETFALDSGVDGILIPSINTFNPGFLGFPASPRPLNAVPNSSQEDLYYLEYLFHTISPSEFTVAGTFFRSLWRAYGVTFSDPSASLLRFSVLASAVVGSSFQSRQEVPQYKYTHYLNQFLNGLRQATEQNNLNETHLFGLYFVIENVSAESRHSELFEKYLDRFCKTMNQLNHQAKESGHEFPLQHVWRLLLSYLRREYLRPSAPNLSIQKKDARLLAMHELDIQLVSSRNLGGRVNRFPGSSYYSEEERCRRLSRSWDVWDILSSLKAKFRVLYYRQSDRPAIETNFLFGRFIDSIRAGTDGFERFQYLHKAFEVSTDKEKGKRVADRIARYGPRF